MNGSVTMTAGEMLDFEFHESGDMDSRYTFYI